MKLLIIWTWISEEGKAFMVTSRILGLNDRFSGCYWDGDHWVWSFRMREPRKAGVHWGVLSVSWLRKLPVEIPRSGVNMAHTLVLKLKMWCWEGRVQVGGRKWGHCRQWMRPLVQGWTLEETRAFRGWVQEEQRAEIGKTLRGRN